MQCWVRTWRGNKQRLVAVAAVAFHNSCKQAQRSSSSVLNTLIAMLTNFNLSILLAFAFALLSKGGARAEDDWQGAAHFDEIVSDDAALIDTGGAYIEKGPSLDFADAGAAYEVTSINNADDAEADFVRALQEIDGSLSLAKSYSFSATEPWAFIGKGSKSNKDSKSKKSPSQSKAFKSKLLKKCKSSKSSKAGIRSTDSLYKTEFIPEMDFPFSIWRFGRALGIGLQKVFNNTLYDTFQVAEAGVLGKILFYAYQTDSTINSTITGAYVTLYKGGKLLEGLTAKRGGMPLAGVAEIESLANDPKGTSVNANGGMVKDEEARARKLSLADYEVIFDGSDKNIMSMTEFSGIYRVPDYNPTRTDRPIMKVHADLRQIVPEGVLLEPNETYWFGVQLTGSLPASAGPNYPKIATDIDVSTGNARQTLSGKQDLGESVAIEDPAGTPIGIPFEIFGCNGRS